MRLVDQPIFLEGGQLIAHRGGGIARTVDGGELVGELLGGNWLSGADILLHQRAQDGLFARTEPAPRRHASGPPSGRHHAPRVSTLFIRLPTPPTLARASSPVKRVLTACERPCSKFLHEPPRGSRGRACGLGYGRGCGPGGWRWWR